MKNLVLIAFLQVFLIGCGGGGGGSSSDDSDGDSSGSTSAGGSTLKSPLIPGALLGLVLLMAAGTVAAQDKPNILVIWGDDIGNFNVSAYHRGMMGYKTPNIDRIANEGMKAGSARQ